ncbi:MAG: hypothetical protein WDM76_01655 [Limisphaerales bacterium]
MKTIKYILLTGFAFLVLNSSAAPPDGGYGGYKKTVRILSVTVQPSEVRLDRHQVHVRVVISEGTGRKGFISIRQTDFDHAAQVAITQLNFDEKQTLVEGDLDITCYKPGSVTLQAKIENLYSTDSSYETTLTIVDKK